MAITSIPSGTHSITWFNEPVAHSQNGYTTYGIHSDTDVLEIGLYHHASQRYTAGQFFPTDGAPLTEHDDHDNNAVLFLNTGKIMSAVSYHPGKQYASVSTNAYDVIGGFTSTLVYDGSTYYGSYAHLAQTNDDLNTIWWFFRDGLSYASGLPVRYRINQNGGNGADWTAQASCVALIEGLPGHRPYFRIASTGRRIDFLYNNGNPGLAEELTNSLYHLYIVVNQAGTQFSAYKTDGTLIDTWAITGGTGLVNSLSLPIPVTSGTLIFNGAGADGRCWVWDAQYVAGQLRATFVTFTQTTSVDDTHRLWQAVCSGTSWSYEAVCYAGDSLTPGTVGRVPHWIPPDSISTSDADRVYTGGICLDVNTPDRVYVSKKYGSQDNRVQQWDKSGGVWSKTADLTGATGNGFVNARPHPVVGSSPSNVLWMTATSYLDYINYTTTTPGLLVPVSLAYTSKPASPTYTSAQAFPGTVAYFPFTEGSGGTIADIVAARNGVLNTGSVTWSTDSLGPYVSAGYSTSVQFRADAVAATSLFNHSAGYPVWMGMLFQSLSSGTAQYSVTFGNSSSTTQRLVLYINNVADNFVHFSVVDNAGQQNTFNIAKTRDTAWHTLLAIGYASNLWRFYVDSALAASGANPTGTRTLDKFTIGCFGRTTYSNPFLGAHGCVVVGQGSAPSPTFFNSDLMSGQFLATRAAYTSGYSPWIFMPEEEPYG